MNQEKKYSETNLIDLLNDHLISLFYEEKRGFYGELVKIKKHIVFKVITQNELIKLLILNKENLDVNILILPECGIGTYLFTKDNDEVKKFIFTTELFDNSNDKYLNNDQSVKHYNNSYKIKQLFINKILELENESIS